MGLFKMIILIEKLRNGYKCDFSDVVKGRKVARAGGYDVYFHGYKNDKETLNGIVNSCLPVIVSIAKVRAMDVKYHRLLPAPRGKKIHPKQKGLL